ncbi:MAG: helix-turn-helix transcriptional regulator [Prevotella sp.]|jgi:transcriptional regulator with XRE-family HTH domain|nr:helix-turn-helix transcriptional regulator [Prevotella sp.]
MNEATVPIISGQRTIAVVHQGLNAKRLREADQISQEYMGKKLNISQQAVSQLEERPVLEDRVIDVYVKELGCKRTHITNMKTDVPADNTVHLKIEHNDNITFNPLDKLIESHDENSQLHERLIENEREKFNIIHEMLKENRLITERLIGLIDKAK